ncbi:hypothetical protein SH661x_003795 [Planctomicrobium sp. SH661]|uniref:hypothetical protein n=1 Tax=Planctomicrobium sp. SH661 TaxID=3448124 RepID=UPI003F5BDC43
MSCTKWCLPFNLLFTLCSIGFGVPVFADDRFELLLKRVPSGANAVMAVDVEAVNESEIARDRGWAQVHAAAYT